MAFFPFFIDLKDKKCVVIGGGEVATRRVDTLLKFGATLTVISRSCQARIKELVQTGLIVYRERQYQSGDLTEAFLAIAATDDQR